MAKAKDAEVTAMSKTAELLGELDADARGRVMRWLCEKFPAVEVAASVERFPSDMVFKDPMPPVKR